MEFACDEEDDGAEAAVAACLSLGGLDEAVEGFEEAVGLSGARPGGDTVEVGADRFGDGLHGLDLGAVHVGAPLVEQALGDVDLLAPEDVGQLLELDPGAGGAFAGDAGEAVELGRSEVFGFFQKRPSQVLEFGLRRCSRRRVRSRAFEAWATTWNLS